MQAFRRTVALTGLAISCASAAARADIVVSSFPDWDNSSSVSVSGVTVAVGQTFVAPATATVLDALSVRVNITSTVSGVRAYVFAASTNQAVGSPLFRSDIFPTMAPTGGFVPLTFNGMNAPVTPGQAYVVLFSNAEDGTAFSMNGFNIASMFTGSSSAAPLLGNAVAMAPPPGAAGLTTASWQNLSGSRDLAMELRFLPSPGAAALFGFAGWRVGRRRGRFAAS